MRPAAPKRLPRPPLKGLKVKGGAKRWQQKLQRQEQRQKRHER